MLVPQSPLSFIFHITEVSPYRDEMHHDMRQALRRFGIDLEMVGRVNGEQEQLDALHHASFNVERASYAKRAPSAPALKKPLDVAAPELFLAIVPLLAWELEHGTPGPDQPVETPYRSPAFTLLHGVYLLFYSSSYRAKNPAPPTVSGPRYAGIDGGEFAEAWKTVRNALDLPPGQRLPAAKTTPALTVLMAALGKEFGAGDGIWGFCW